MKQLNLNPDDGIQTALPETYSEKELLNALDMIWKNRIFVKPNDIDFLIQFSKRGFDDGTVIVADDVTFQANSTGRSAANYKYSI
jgi:hypothetical protein